MLQRVIATPRLTFPTSSMSLLSLGLKDTTRVLFTSKYGHCRVFQLRENSTKNHSMYNCRFRFLYAWTFISSLLQTAISEHNLDVMQNMQIVEFLQLQILSTCALGLWKQSVGWVLLTFLALYVITQLFWILIALQYVGRKTKLVSCGLLKAAIVMNIYTHAFKVAKTQQFAVSDYCTLVHVHSQPFCSY